jgi:hypothetical protein
MAAPKMFPHSGPLDPIAGIAFATMLDVHIPRAGVGGNVLENSFGSRTIEHSSAACPATRRRRGIRVVALSIE